MVKINYTKILLDDTVVGVANRKRFYDMTAMFNNCVFSRHGNYLDNWASIKEFYVTVEEDDAIALLLAIYDISSVTL